MTDHTGTDRNVLLAAVKAANPLPVDVALPAEVMDAKPPFALLIADAGMPDEGLGSAVVARSRGWRGPVLAAAVMTLILLLAGVAVLAGRRQPSREGDAIAPAVTPTTLTPTALQPPVCDLFTDEDLTRIVRDAYLAAGDPTTDEFMPTHLVGDTRGYGDSCDWLEPLSAWVVLERLRDSRQIPEWERSGFYQTTVDQAFAAHPAMPVGVEVANVRVRRGFMVWVSIDVRIVDHAPEWWRFSMAIGDEDFYHAWDPSLAEDIAWGVAGQVFERIESAPGRSHQEESS
jgi:hypothetical protein